MSAAALPPQAELPDVTVTVVLYNSDDHLAACLEAIADDVGTGSAVVVAVDNASPDTSAAIVKRELPTSRVISSEVNRGFAGGCNLAWPEVRTRYWLLINPDVVLDPGALGELVRWMDRHPTVGLGSAWLRNREGRLQYPGRIFPSIPRTLLELLRLHRLLPSAARAALLRGPYVRAIPAGSELVPADWLPGAALVARREAVFEVGLLDEAFFLYGEDLDWCWRMRKAGWEVACCPSAVATHHVSTSSRKTWSDDVVEERIAAGVAEACRRTRGVWYARAYGVLTVLALTVEAWHPRRDAVTRSRARSVRRAWRRATMNLR